MSMSNLLTYSFKKEQIKKFNFWLLLKPMSLFSFDMFKPNEAMAINVPKVNVEMTFQPTVLIEVTSIY